MQDRFYADKKDVWKWIVALRAAAPSRRILYVAMRTKSETNSYSGLFRERDEITRRVVEFFDKEVRELSTLRSLERITGLDPGIELAPEFYSAKDPTYFRAIENRLRKREKNRKYVVLLDPDTGIESKSPDKHKHLLLKDIVSVWSWIEPGDILLVYQERYFEPDWQDKKQKQLQEALGKRVKVKIESHPALRNQMCILRADKL